MELQGRGLGSEVCVYVCERACVHMRAREGRECKLDVCQHIAYMQGLITNVSFLLVADGKKCSGSMGRVSEEEKW